MRRRGSTYQIILFFLIVLSSTLFIWQIYWERKVQTVKLGWDRLEAEAAALSGLEVALGRLEAGILSAGNIKHKVGRVTVKVAIREINGEITIVSRGSVPSGKKVISVDRTLRRKGKLFESEGDQKATP